MSKHIANLLLLLTGAVWGIGFVAQETAMQDMGPMLFVGLRFLLAGLVVLPFAVWEQNRSHSGFGLKEILVVLPVGFVFFLGMASQQIGLLATTVTNAGFLTALYVVFVPLILRIFLREPQAIIIWPASFIALVGIYLLSGGEILSLNWGDWLIIVSAGFWAAQVILVGKIGASTRQPVTLATAQFLICSVLALTSHFLAPLFHVAEPALSWSVLLEALPEIAYAGVIAGALAFTMQAVGQQYTSASVAAILLSCEALFAALSGAVLLGERLSMVGYLGCALIFTALLMVELRDGLLKFGGQKI